MAEGTALRYGDRADFGLFQERFEPGAFVSLGDVIANLQHRRDRPLGRTGDGGGLILTDTPEELRASLTLPDTTDGRDAGELLRRRVLQGWSVEFVVREEEAKGTVRIIKRAELHGLALVDRPAYGESLAKVRDRFLSGAGPGWLV